MRAADEETRWRSAPQLLVLHAVRLAGFARTDAIADRTGISTSHVPLVLDVLEGRSLVEAFSFGEDRGWILTDEGRIRDDEWVKEEVCAAEAGTVLASTAAGFESLNGRLVSVISHWQLETVGNDDTEREGAGPEVDSRGVIEQLAQLEPSLAALMEELSARLPRFNRYAAQFTAALRKAERKQLRWIAGVGILSCHTVWAELHQDLLTTLGRDRSVHADPSRRQQAGDE